MAPADLDINKIANTWSALLQGNVFYLPILGPVYAGNHSVRKVLYDVLKNSQTDKFLRYDKNARWFTDKRERIILSAIHFKKHCLIIPVEDHLNNQWKIFCYSQSVPRRVLEQWIERLAQIDIRLANQNKISLYFFDSLKKRAERDQHSIYLKIIGATDELNTNPSAITTLDKLPSRLKSTLGLLGQEPELAGFSFLAQKIRRDKQDPASVICAVAENQIVGAIGPIDVAYDAWGDKWLLPPYFGVRKKFRSLGYGEKLWKTAMNAARREGALYTLVQNQPGSPAAQFYEKNGLVQAMTYSMTTISFHSGRNKGVTMRFH
jgi:GNAT superfamily N-acetyltransferase